MEIKTTRDIVFKHIKDYFPDDKRWDTDKWVALDDIKEIHKRLEQFKHKTSVKKAYEHDIQAFITYLFKEVSQL